MLQANPSAATAASATVASVAAPTVLVPARLSTDDFLGYAAGHAIQLASVGFGFGLLATLLAGAAQWGCRARSRSHRTARTSEHQRLGDEGDAAEAVPAEACVTHGEEHEL